MSNYLLVLVKDLSVFSETQIGRDLIIENREINLDDLLNFCKEITYSTIIKLNKNNFLKFSIQKDVSFNTILSDDLRLKQILLNLLINAVKFTNNGQIQLFISSQKLSNCEMLKIKVSDTGDGIDEKIQKKFLIMNEDSWRESDENEYYLGLKIVLMICNKLGGTIKIESSKGRGSTFSVDIPVDIPSSDTFKYTLTTNMDVQDINSDSKSSLTSRSEFWPGNFKGSLPYLPQSIYNNKSIFKKSKNT
jgi:signal transduction histidine kinase